MHEGVTLATHQSQNRIQSIDASLQMPAKQSTFVPEKPHKEKGVQKRGSEIK